MNKCKGTLFRSIATRAVIAVIPAAMVSAYASGIFVSPPRMASYAYIQVAEITQTPNTIGMAESPLYGMTDQQISDQLDQLQSIGVQNIRVFVPWGLIEQTDNAYDWSLIDRVMSAAAARNMGVMAEVNGTPSFAGPNPGNPGFPPGSDTPNVTKFTDFMQAFMAHLVPVNGVNVSYASIVSAYEIWNEPNSIMFSNPISPEAYAALLAAVYPIIKSVDPTATVVAGAVGAAQDGPFTIDPVEFVQRMLTALGPNALDYFDALSVHPYSDQIPFSGTCPTCSAGILTPREQVEAIMAMIGGKQVWLSEYGVASTDPASYQQQAEWIKDLLDTWQNYDQAGPVFLYTARDTAGSSDPGATLGVWTSVGGEKAYTFTDPETGETVTKSVSQMLADWITAHPMPTNPGIPILSPIAALVQALVAGVQGFVNAVVTAITNFLGGLSGLAAVTTSATPLALRVASVESADAVAAGTEEATAAAGNGAEAASKEAATENTATAETATAEVATAEVAAEETATPAQPAVEETVTVTETKTDTAVPAKATETATATEPAKATEGTGSTETSTGATTPGSSTETGKPDEAGKSDEAGKASEAGKTGEAGKSGASEGQSKSGRDADHEDGSGRQHAHGKDGGGSVVIKAKPIPVTAGVMAGAEGAEGASDSTGGATS
jgi:hypothetical protein